LTIILSVALGVLGHDCCEAAVGSVWIFRWVLGVVSGPLRVLRVVISSLSVRVSGCWSSWSFRGAVLCTISTAIATCTSVAVALASVAITTTITAVTTVATIATVTIAASAAVTITVTVAVGWWTFLKRLVISLHLLKQLSAQLLGFSYTFWSGSPGGCQIEMCAHYPIRNVRDVKIHGLITFLARLWLHETRSTALDLDLAAGLLLDVLDVVATTTYDLRTKIEATDRFETNGELLLGPLPL
jgi:hypothetical protein